MKNLKFYLIMGIASLGVVLILLSMYVLEYILPVHYSGIVMVIGFLLVVLSLVFMRYAK